MRSRFLRCSPWITCAGQSIRRARDVRITDTNHFWAYRRLDWHFGPSQVHISAKIPPFNILMSATTSRLSQDGVGDETVTLLLSKEDDEEAASAIPTAPTTHCSSAEEQAEDERSEESASARAVAPHAGWPRTFERSMALLACPILPAADAARYSKSPAPGAVGLVLLLRRRGSDLDRGIHSPGPTATTSYGSNVERNVTAGSRSERNLDCAPLLARSPSLNFQKNHFAVHDVQQEQQKRQTEAKMYRQKLLQKNKMKQKIRKNGVSWPPVTREWYRSTGYPTTAKKLGLSRFPMRREWFRSRDWGP
jgi:hypothetical protein